MNKDQEMLTPDAFWAT